MQLVREIQVGMGVDGDGESNVQAGVPNVAGGSITEVARLGGFRGLVGLSLPPAAGVPKNPHTFLTNIGDLAPPAAVPFAVAAQLQIATFFASGGRLVIDPDGAGPIFETPVVLPPPESLSFLP